MKTLSVILASAFAMGASSDTDRILFPLEPVDNRSLACGCTFNAVNADAGGNFYAGPELLVLDPFADEPSALVNLGQGDIQLRPAQPIVLPLFQCAAGETWTSEWLSETVMVKAELHSLKPGEESCWFAGTVAITVEGHSELVPINGACGC